MRCIPTVRLSLSPPPRLKSALRDGDVLFVRLSGSCKLYFCWRWGLIVSAIRAALTCYVRVATHSANTATHGERDVVGCHADVLWWNGWTDRLAAWYGVRLGQRHIFTQGSV